MLLRETITSYQALAMSGMTFGWGLILGSREESIAKNVGYALNIICCIILWALM